jgi:TonB family protein
MIGASQQRTRLIRFIAFSLILHLVAVSGIYLSVSAPETSLAEKSIVVDLVAPAFLAPDEKTGKIAQPIRSTHLKQYEMNQKSIRRPATLHQEGPSRDKIITGKSSGTPSSDSIDIPLGYLIAIRDRLEQAKRYPWMARVRGLEGTSLIRFKIGMRGTVDEVGIIRSSAHKVLDDAAIETVQRAAPFPSLPEELNADRIELSVPLVFKIK